MFFFAKLKCTDVKNVKAILTAFFEEFNRESSITIKGGEVILNIHFDQPPMKTIDSLSDNEIVEFQYDGKKIERLDEGNLLNKREEVLPEKDKNMNESSEQHKEPTDNEDTETSVHIETDSVDSQITQEFSKFVQDSTSFESLLIRTAKWLDLGKNEELFITVVKAAVKVGTSWKNIHSELTKQGIACENWRKNYLYKRVSERMKSYGYNANFITLVEMLIKYSDYDFNQKEVVPQEAIAEKEDVPIHKKDQKKVKLIPILENMFLSVDTTKIVPEQIRQVLNDIGLSQYPSEKQKSIFEFVNEAVNYSGGIAKFIKDSEKTPKLMDRMDLSALIRQFIQKNGLRDHVKAEEFLERMKLLVMV